MLWYLFNLTKRASIQSTGSHSGWWHWLLFHSGGASLPSLGVYNLVCLPYQSQTASIIPTLVSQYWLNNPRSKRESLEFWMNPNQSMILHTRIQVQRLHNYRSNKRSKWSICLREEIRSLNKTTSPERSQWGFGHTAQTHDHTVHIQWCLESLWTL